MGREAASRTARRVSGGAAMPTREARESVMPRVYLGGSKRRTVRCFRIGAMLVVVPLVLVGCTSGSSQTASHKTSTSGSRSSAATTVTPGSTAKLIQPPGPISARPALLDEAKAACRRAAASDIPSCAGTIDAEVWGLPLVILSQLRDTLACQFRVNVLYNATTLAGPDSTLVTADPNDGLQHRRVPRGQPDQPLLHR